MENSNEGLYQGHFRYYPSAGLYQYDELDDMYGGEEQYKGEEQQEVVNSPVTEGKVGEP